MKQSEKLYNSIVEGDNDSRLKSSLENIKCVCDEIENHGGRIYVGLVGKLCRENYTGPAAQSIRNQPGTLKRYVDLRAAEQLLPTESGQSGEGIKISDPKVRAYVLMLEERVRDCEEVIRILKKLFTRIAPVEVDKLIAGAFTNGALLELPPATGEHGDNGNDKLHLSGAARQALEKLTSESHLSPFGLSLYKGRVISETRRKFLDKDEVQALLDLLAV